MHQPKGRLNTKYNKYKRVTHHLVHHLSAYKKKRRKRRENLWPVNSRTPCCIRNVNTKRNMSNDQL